jgi:hypothetical protein
VTESDLLSRDGGSFDIVVAPGEMEATRQLRTDEFVHIGDWQAVGREVLPDGRDGDHVSFAIRVSRIAHPRLEVFLFEGEGHASVGNHFVDCLIPADAPVVLTVRLPAVRERATNVRLQLIRHE